MKPQSLLSAKILVAAISLMLFGGLLSAQNTITVTGTVTTPDGEPVIGAALMVKGTLNGTVTDELGAFEIEARSNAVLEVSSIGYETLEVAIDGKTRLDITLNEDNTELEATVVVAYGEVRAKDFTGAVQQINVAQSPQARMGMNSPGEFLRGTVPGMQMGQSGQVGQNPSMLVRGRRSLGSTSSEPLIVVDGMIYKGSMSNIDPNNIESMSVLKDASSLAAYGSQAAQGVIMITTKKGLSGKPTIEFSTTQSFNVPSVTLKYYDAKDYLAVRNARIGNYDKPDDTSLLSDLELKNYKNGTETDWFKLATQVGHTQNYNARVSGGTDSINYSLSFGRSMQNGVQVGNNFNRTNINARINAKINKYIEAGLSMDYSGTTSTGGSADMSGLKTSPLGSPYFDNSHNMRRYPTGNDNTSSNVLWPTDPANGYERKMDGIRTTYNGFIDVKFPWIEGLSYKLNVSYGRNTNDNYSFYHENYYPAIASGNNEDGYTSFSLTDANGSISYNKGINWVIDNIITYAHSFGKHGINSSLVYTRDSDEAQSQSLSGSNFSDFGNTLLGWYGLNQAGTRTINAGNYSLHNDIGYLVRVMYSYDARYSLNVSYRRDGSSVFGAKKKWGNFPAIGAAWTISNEKFMRNAKKIDDLKLKASWGINGSQTLAPYGTLSTVTLGKSSTGLQEINGGSTNTLYSQYVSAIGNPDLGWQQTESFNAGIEVTAFNRKVNADINGYFSKTTDQIFSRTIPIMGAGVSSQMATMGQINNWGLEAVVNYNTIQKKDFSWSNMLTFNLNRNKLIKLWGGDDEQDDLTNGYFIGKSLDVIWWYDWDGIVQESGKGSLPSRTAGYANIIDQDGNGQLNNDDKVFLGNSRENFRLTWSSTLSYKNWQLFFTFNGTFGGHGYALGNNTFARQSHQGFAYANSFEIPYWTPTNKSNKCMTPQATDGDWRVYNSYANVRLQNVSISYNLTPLVKNIGIKGARITASGQNLFYIAPKWEMSDPEARSNSSMLMRTFTIGFNFSL